MLRMTSLKLRVNQICCEWHNTCCEYCHMLRVLQNVASAATCCEWTKLFATSLKMLRVIRNISVIRCCEEGDVAISFLMNNNTVHATVFSKIGISFWWFLLKSIANTNIYRPNRCSISLKNIKQQHFHRSNRSKHGRKPRSPKNPKPVQVFTFDFQF